MLCHIRCFTSIYFEWIFNVCSIKAIFCSPFFYIWNNVSVVCYSHDVVCLHSLMLLPLFDYNLFIWQEGGRTRKKNTHTPRKKTEEEIFHSMSRKLVLDARITSVWWFYSFCVYFQFNFQLFIAVAGRELKLTDHVWSTACFLPLSHSVTHLLCFLVSITFVAVLILSNRLNGKRRRVLSFVANNDSLAWWSWANKKPFLFNAKFI